MNKENKVKIEFENLRKMSEKLNASENTSISEVENYHIKYDKIFNMSNDKILRKYVHENLKMSEKCLNDFKDYEDINNYLDYLYKTYEDNMYIPKEKKVFFYTYLDNIQEVFKNVIEILKKEISYKKHLKLLNEIENILLSSKNIENFSYYYDNFDFVENIINSSYFYYFSCIVEDEVLNPKYNKYFENYIIPSISLIDEEEKEDFKTHYEIIKYTFKKVLNVLCKIIKENEINLKFE